MQYRRKVTPLVVATMLASLYAACGTNGSDPIAPAIRNTPLGPDTSSAVIPDKVSLTGRVLALSVHRANQDTLQFTGVARSKVRLVRNILVDGEARQVLVAQLTTSSTGDFAANGIPGGYYAVYAEPPADAGLTKSYALLAALKSPVQVTVYVSKR